MKKGLTTMNHEAKIKKAPGAGVKVTQSVMFPGEWRFEIYDKDGVVFSKSGFSSEASARATLTRIKKVFRNRFLSIKTI